MTTELHKLPLRERKYARTKLTLRDAVAEALEAHSLEEVTVKALCEQAMISEATFFNYFPRKTDLINYLVQLWSLELNWHGQQASRRQAGVAVIGAVIGIGMTHGWAGVRQIKWRVLGKCRVWGTP